MLHVGVCFGYDVILVERLEQITQSFTVGSDGSLLLTLMQLRSYCSEDVECGGSECFIKICNNNGAASSCTAFESHSCLKAERKLILERGLNELNLRNFIWTLLAWPIFQRFSHFHQQNWMAYRRDDTSYIPTLPRRDHSRGG